MGSRASESETLEQRLLIAFESSHSEQTVPIIYSEGQVLDAACAWKLGSLAFKLLARGSKLLDHELIATSLEIGANSVEAGEALHDRQRDLVRAAAARLQAKIERHSDEWLRSEFGSDPAGRADALAAIATLDDILPKCLPDGLTVARANLNTERIADLVVAKAGQADAVFRERTFGGRLLHCLVQHSYEEAKRDRDFAAVSGIPVQEVLLNRTDQLVAGQTAMQQQIAELKAIFALQIAATTTEYRLPREVVDRLLMTTIGLADVEQAAIPAAFGEVARRFAAMRDILEQQRNEDPEIADLKEQARSALTIADLDATERLLGAIRRRQRALSDRRLRAAKEARADLISALEDEAETCMQQANAALLRFDTTMAWGYYRDAIAVLTDTPLEKRWRYTLKGADSLREFGDFAGRNETLLASIELYRLALQAAPRDHVPLDWATTQNKLGAALLKLGERENGTARLEEAVVAFHAALAVRGRDPFDWAMTQSNLGTALLRLGERKNVRARLEEAVTAYCAALEELSRNRDRPVGSLLWASMQNNLGGALTILAKGESGTARLKDAVTAHRAALEELSPNRVLLNWAPTQKDLDIAEKLIRNGVLLDWAAVAEKLSRNPVPLDWAAIQNNLGIALLMLGQRENETARFEQAVVAFRAALSVTTRDRVPLLWAATQSNLGDALRLLGESENGTARLKEAVTACREALEERSRERVPLDWAGTQNNLGIALWRLGERGSGTARLEEASAAFEACLTIAETAWPGERVRQVRSHRDKTRAEIARRLAVK